MTTTTVKTYTASRPGQAYLRMCPYPYRAALTIANDRHGLHDLEEFRALHRFLNTAEETPYGKGLGLEISDSFWFYDDIGRFSYFDGYTKKPSAQAPFIRDFIEAGYLDMLHTYGDFAHQPFERKYAEWAVEELLSRGLSVPVWSNHGNERNIQSINVGVPYHQGATPGTAGYHFDLTRKLGLKYFWRMITPFLGQERRLSFAEYCSPRYYYWNALDRLYCIPKRALECFVVKVLHRYNGVNGNAPPLRTNVLMSPLYLEDGHRVWEFRRFNNHEKSVWAGADADGLCRQLAPDVLNRLESIGGYVIIYTHFELGTFYQDSVLRSLRLLSQRFHEGRIWVTTVSRMLEYNRIRRLLRWEEILTPEGLEIRIQNSMDDPILGKQPLTPDMLGGITIVVPSARPVTVTLDGQPLPCREVERDSDEVTLALPWQPLEYPD
ncbi:MAG: hypothetical protein D6800_12275 [Candidatus Zixiibacteriota bacterium]|nr:MAG: hypothetical protein D6800_12275 [candidate division Zixibacteria bacterium]